MKNVLIGLLFAALLAYGAWRVLPSKQIEKDAFSPAAISPQRTRLSKSTRHQSLLERVRIVAQRSLPDVDFTQREELALAQVDTKIDELKVMEFLLDVETEFDIDIPESRINEFVGASHRRDLVNHLSLSLIAELVDGIPSSAVR
jgi:acyl carrier protein